MTRSKTIAYFKNFAILESRPGLFNDTKYAGVVGENEHSRYVHITGKLRDDCKDCWFDTQNQVRESVDRYYMSMNPQWAKAIDSLNALKTDAERFCEFLTVDNIKSNPHIVHVAAHGLLNKISDALTEAKEV